MRRWSIPFAFGLFLTACGADQPAWDESASAESTSQVSTAPQPSTAPADLPPSQSAPGHMPRDMLMDPVTCKGCHPTHYREWEGSMHAYAADDPVFIAMNKRGQRETNGALGDFCVKCHAPMAVREGLTKDGLNLAEVPRAMKGVTCYFCHNAVDVGPQHFNNPIAIANDTIMRGSIRNPVDPKVHGVAYSEWFDNNKMKSSIMCGSCHDIVNPKGAHIERTLSEYKESMMSIDRGVPGVDSCQGCHMRWTRDGTTAEILGMALPQRDLHEHRWAAVDVALTDWPHQEEYRKMTQCELDQGGVIMFEIYTDGRGLFKVSLESMAGHALPSGATQDRRMWLEFIAYNQAGKVIFQTGVIPDGEVEDYPVGHPKYDRNLFMLRSRWKDETGHETHNFWDATGQPEGNLLPPPLERGVPHVAYKNFTMPGRQQPSRVEMRVRMRPIGLDVLQDLVDSGDLDPAVMKKVPTFTLTNTHVVWEPGDGNIVTEPRRLSENLPYCDR